jgi:hypothetical protein
VDWLRQRNMPVWRDKEAIAQENVLKKIEPHLNAGKPALTLELTPAAKVISSGASSKRNRRLRGFDEMRFHRRRARKRIVSNGRQRIRRERRRRDVVQI